jgi:hypothetical protein
MLKALFTCAPSNLLELEDEKGVTLEQYVNRGTVVRMAMNFINHFERHFQITEFFLRALRAQIPTTLEAITDLFDKNFNEFPDLKKRYEKEIKPKIAYYWEAAKLPFHKMLDKFSAQSDDQKAFFRHIQTGNTDELRKMLAPGHSSGTFSAAPRVNLSEKTFCGLTPVEVADHLGNKSVLRLFLGVMIMQKQPTACDMSSSVTKGVS